MAARRELYGTVFGAAEGSPGPEIDDRDVDRPGATVWYEQNQAMYSSTISICGETPMADKSNDPVAIWQNMIGEMEKGFNSFANQAMASPEFSKVVNQVGGVSAGAQKQLGDLMEKYLLTMNLPSRAQMVSMAERLQSIEGQLNEIKALLHQAHGNADAADGGFAAAPRPPRTRRPPSADGEQK
jgi:hypothetical protein